MKAQARNSPINRLRKIVSGRMAVLRLEAAKRLRDLTPKPDYSAARLNSGNVQRASLSRLNSRMLAGSTKGRLQRVPDIDHAFHEMDDMFIRVQGAWRDAQTLFALGDRRIIDRLDINPVAIEQAGRSRACRARHRRRAPARYGTGSA